MLRLMNLELTRIKKNRLKGILLELIIMSIVLIFLIASTVNIADIAGMLENVTPAEQAEIMRDMMEFQEENIDDMLIVTIMALPFLIYSAINYSRFVVKDYETGWIQEMFTYPISRKKMLGSKILLGYLISTLGMLFSAALVYGVLSIMHIAQFSLSAIIQIATTSLLTPLIALVAMAVGINKKSSTTTIVTGTIMTILLQSNTGSFSLQNFPFVNYSLAFAGIVLVCFILSKINRYDFVK